MPYWACCYAQYSRGFRLPYPILACSGLGVRSRVQHVRVQTMHLDPFLNSNGFEPNTRRVFFSRPHASPSIFYTNQISIILSRIQLKISQRWNYTLAPPLHKMTRFMGYKYTINLSSQRFTISSLSTAYIFSKHLSLKYCCTISLYKATNITHSVYQPFGLFLSSYQIPWLWRMNQIAWTKRSINYPIH